MTPTLVQCGKLLFAAALLAALLTGSVSAQEDGGQNATVSPTEDCKVLDGNTYVCSSSLEDGDAVLEFYSDVNQTIKLGDAGVFLSGGEMRIEEFDLNADRLETVRMPVTVDGGESAVAISTREGQFGEPVGSGPWWPELPGEPSPIDWALAGGTVLVTATGIIVACAWWFRSARGGVTRVF